jgi:imidazolonepropionase-like amidohydrolase
MEMMVDYGMKPLDVLRSATSINARVFHLDKLGEIKNGFLADLIVVKGQPDKTMSDIRKIQMVIKNGVIVK